MRQTNRTEIAFLQERIRGEVAAGVRRSLTPSASKIVGKEYEYDGQVVLLFGEDDTVIRWRDVFPDCEDSSQVEQSLVSTGETISPRLAYLE